MLFLLLPICLRSKLQRLLRWLRCCRLSKRSLPNDDKRLVNVSSDFDSVWYDWLEVVGVEIDCEIEEELERSRFMLDMDDGTHAQWRESHLGVLLMLTKEEVEDLVVARHLSNSGDIEGWVTLTTWVMGFTSFLDQCLLGRNREQDL